MAAQEDIARKRSKRTNAEQLEIIINFCEMHKCIISGKTHPLDVLETERVWDDLVALLNGVERGARKDKKQWKAFLSEWKCKTRKKARLSRTAFTKTGGGAYINTSLSTIENRLIQLTGVVSVLGCDELPPEVDPQQTETMEHVPAVQEENGTHELQDINMQHDVAEEDEPASVDEPVVPSLARKRPLASTSGGKRKRQRTGLQLENSARLYAEGINSATESTTLLATSINNVSSSINNLAAAMNNFANACNNLASAMAHKQ